MTLRRPSRLARNAVAAGLLVALTATGAALAVHDGGGADASCPAGQSWVTAAAVAAAFALSDDSARAEQAAAETPAVPVLAGCVDLTRLHPMPSPADDRG